MLAMNDNSTSGLRNLKKKHKIDKYGQRMGTKQSTITAAFAAATAVANLVTGFKASTFRYLFVHSEVVEACGSSVCILHSHYRIQFY